MKATRAAIVAVLWAAAGCAQMGGVGDILGGVLGNPAGGTETGAVVAEVRTVDDRNQVLEVRTDAGQNVDIRYDQNTRVVYRQREYEVTSLEPGDVVRMDVTRTTGNEYYTQQIDVQQSVQERRGESGSTPSDDLYQINGTVDQIDQSRGLFTLRTRDGDVITVAMPYNASTSARDRVERLRRGNTVAVEGRFVNQERLELSRFL